MNKPIIVPVSQDNYHRFDDLIFYRIHGRRRNQTEKLEPKDFTECFNTLKDPNLYVFAAQIDDNFIGWISLVYLPKVGRTNGRGYLFVDELWIDEAFRGKGIAKLLMAKADEVATNAGCLGIRLYVSPDNASAIGLYEKCDYKNKRESYYMDKDIEIR